MIYFTKCNLNLLLKNKKKIMIKISSHKNSFFFFSSWKLILSPIPDQFFDHCTIYKSQNMLSRCTFEFVIVERGLRFYSEVNDYYLTEILVVNSIFIFFKTISNAFSTVVFILFCFYFSMFIVTFKKLFLFYDFKSF